MHHELRPCSAGIGLGSHDLGVVTLAASLYHKGMFAVLVFSGANSPTTVDKFPRGEAVHYGEHAMKLGVPADAIIIESRATNTGQNIDFSRRALPAEPDLVCASEDLSFDEYLETIGDSKLVIDMLTGDPQRVIDYPARGFAIPQDVPADVTAAYQRLITAGYDSRLS